MKTLIELRDEIDRIDKEMVRLFEERMLVAENVAKYKMTIGKAVLDKTREKEKIENVRSLAHTDFNARGVEALFSQLMTISRMRQYMLMAQADTDSFGFKCDTQVITQKTKVVFAGVRGAYGQQAMDGYFGKDIDSFNVTTFKEAMDKVSSGEAEYGVLPIENSSTGIITDVYDLLAANNNYIVGVYDVKVEHALLGIPGAKIEQIKTVYSHAQGLLQCRKFLKDKNWEEISLANTAIAAKKVVDDKDPSQAAIASVLAAKVHGLDILAKEINDIDNNTTRFIIIKNQKHFTPEADKISICFEVAHESGTLYNVLSHFIFNGLNMSKIESRPIRGQKFQYRFFVDFEGNLNDKNVIGAMTGIMSETQNFRILGNYESID
ncbi:MAG: chorismate mutase [Clostridiales bacterium]|nr:chorismate mutase [Clostridiales bacterium]MDY3747444.1 prephenate dehydratase domain-containing protein [Lachnospiraceae bacterium]